MSTRLTRLSRTLVAASGLLLAPLGPAAHAQSATSTCAAAAGPLTPQQESMVNDYEIQVARANSKHTPVPPMPDTVFALIGCLSPSTQAGSNASASTSGSGSSSAANTSGSASSSSSSSSSSSGTSGFVCPPDGLSKAQQSMINDYEILVARANSKHTPVPDISPDVANLINCQ